jgi:hypothetical protein
VKGWKNGSCDVCGGLGASYEERAVGTMMVCENGHHWVAYRMPGSRP